MKIDFSYIPQAFYSFKEKAYDSLTPKQKLVCAVALAALAGLVFCAKVLYTRYKENINRLRLETEEQERESAQNQLRLEAERERLERHIQQKLENDNKIQQLTTEASDEALDPLIAEAKFQEAFSYGRPPALSSAYSSFLMKQKKWPELERHLFKEMEIIELFQGDNYEMFKAFWVKEMYAKALLKQNKTPEALTFLEKELVFHTQAFYSNAVLSRYYVESLSDQVEVATFIENGYKNNFSAFCKNSFLINQYANFLLFDQDNAVEVELILEKVLRDEPEVFYSMYNLSELHALILVYYQNNFEKGEEFLLEAMKKHPKEPLLIFAYTDALIHLNRPYDDIIAGIQSVLPELLDGSLDCDEFQSIALLSKYIEVQRQFSYLADNQFIKLDQIMRDLRDGLDGYGSYEKTWLGVGCRVLGHSKDSLQLLQEAQNETPTDRITRREFEKTLREAEAKHKEAYESNYNTAQSYFSFLAQYKEEREVVDFFHQVVNTNHKIAKDCLHELLHLEKFELVFLLLENQLKNHRDEFVKAELHDIFVILSLYEAKKNQEKVLELLENPQCAWPFMNKYKFLIEASLQINKPYEEIIQNLGKGMEDWSNGFDTYQEVALLANYIDLHLKCGKSIDAPLAQLQEHLKKIPGNPVEKYEHSVGFRALGDVEKAQALLKEAYEDDPKNYLIKHEYFTHIPLEDRT